jgi:hypothetical protein
MAMLSNLDTRDIPSIVGKGKPKSKPRSGTDTRQKFLPVTARYSPAEFGQLDEAASRAGLTLARARPGGHQALHSIH